jgi:hypothetical protein
MDDGVVVVLVGVQLARLTARVAAESGIRSPLTVRTARR